MQIPQKDWIRAIDVSQFNNNGQPIDWTGVVPALKLAGIERVIVRSSYGPNYEDPQFRANWTALKQLGMPVGAYHAAVPGLTPNLDAHAQDQSAFFLNLINQVGGIQGDDWPILDLENVGGLAPDQLTLWASHWLSCVDAAVRNPKNPAIFYSYEAFITAHMGLYPTLARRPLWIAVYPGGSAVPPTAPANVGAWTHYFGWQYTDALTIPGIAGNVDGSVFAEGSATPSPTPEPQPAPTPDVSTLEAENAALTAKIANAQKALS